jgi:predicted NAD/FAD-dependent oxidoreductase
MVGEDGRHLSPEEKLQTILLADSVRDKLDSLRRHRVAAKAGDISLRAALDEVLSDEYITDEERRAVEWHIALMARDDCGADDPSLSLLWWDEGYEVYGYGDSVFADGFGALTKALGTGLDIRMQHVVRRVEYGPSRVCVTTSEGSFEADAAIITLPLGVLKAGSVEFSPRLPVSKEHAIARLGMGHLAKVVLRYDRPFWHRDQYLYGYLCRPVKDWPTMVISLTKTHDIAALVMQVGGSLARRIEEMTTAECQSWALNVVRDVFGDATPAPRSVDRTQWSHDPLSRGSYTYVAVGSTPDDIATLAEPVDDKLYFAGEATYRYHWAGAHGALASGIREAARILDDPAVLIPRAFTENRRWRDTMMRATRLFNAMSQTVDVEEIESRVALLANGDIFSEVPPNELRVLATMFEPVTFRAGEMLCELGAPADRIYVIAAGRVEVQLADGRFVVSHGRGGLVGEYGLFHRGRATATVVAVEPTSAFALDYQRFQRFRLRFPSRCIPAARHDRTAHGAEQRAGGCSDAEARAIAPGTVAPVLVYAVLVVVGTLGAISDAILNQWAKTGGTSWLVVAYASWIVVATLLGYILRLNYFTFGAAVVLFLMVNSVAALILDRALFAGRLTARGWLGIGLAVAAIICIESSRPHNPPPGP